MECRALLFEDHLEETAQKYIARGWSFTKTVHDGGSDRDCAFLERTRWIDDKHSWIVPLDMTGIETSDGDNSVSASLGRKDALYMSNWAVTRGTGGTVMTCTNETSFTRVPRVVSPKMHDYLLRWKGKRRSTSDVE